MSKMLEETGWMLDEAGWLKMHWFQFVLIRLFFVFIPQCSYINEEEFSHSEDVADEIFGKEGSKICRDTDLRTFVTLLFLYRIPFQSLRTINEYCDWTYGNIITPYTLLIAPRLWMCCLSFLCDHLIYKITICCERSAKEAAIARLLFAGSYASVIFMARTFTASLQTILFCVLLYTVIKKSSEHKDEFGNYMKNQTTIIKESFVLGGIVSVGVTLSSTFWIFIFWPAMYWILMPKISLRLVAMKLCLVFINTCIIMSGLMIYKNKFDCVVDVEEDLRSSYLKTVSRRKIMDSFESDASMSIYLNNNLESGVLVIADLLKLLGPLPLLVYIEVRSMTRAYHDRVIFKRKNLLFYIFFFSVGLLAVHNSFLMTFPLIIPVVVISSSINMCKPLFFCRSWCFLNFFWLLYFGFTIRGGVYNSTVFLNDLSLRDTTKGFSDLAVFYYKTPLPLKYQMQSTVDSYTGLENVNLKLNLVDAGNEENLLHGMIDILLLQSPNVSLLLVMPASTPCRELLLLHTRYNIKLYKQFYPHVDPENLNHFLEPNELCTSTGAHLEEDFIFFVNKLSLNLYLVTKHKTKDLKPIRKKEMTEEIRIVEYYYAVKE